MHVDLSIQHWMFISYSQIWKTNKFQDGYMKWNIKMVLLKDAVRKIWTFDENAELLNVDQWISTTV